MKIISNLTDIYIPKAAITIGTFDGVHLGHKKVIRQLKLNAQKNNAKSVIISFKNHPRQVVDPNYKIKLLTTLEEKIQLLKKLNIDYFLLLKFDKQLANMTAKQFIEYLSKYIGIKVFIIGYDNRFGKNRDSNSQLIKKLSNIYDFQVVYIYPLYMDHQNISSTKIRKALQEGDIIKANKFLGYHYFISGEVIQGDKIGKRLGFPTANIKIPQDKLLPKNGVYATTTVIDDFSYWSMTNIGYKPTVFKNKRITIESHIFNFKGDIYGKKITVKFIEHLRDEQQFNSVEDLRKQLKIDEQRAKLILTTKL